MPAPRSLLLAAALLALTPSLASAQTADDTQTADDAAAATAPPADDPCDAQCQADTAAAPVDDTADDPDAGDEPVDDSDLADDDSDGSDADDTPTAGTLDAALDAGWVDGGTFRAPAAGRLKVTLTANASSTGPVLARASYAVGRRSSVALKLKLTGAGRALLADADDDLTLVARTAWTTKRTHRTRTTQRRVALPLDA